MSKCTWSARSGVIGNVWGSSKDNIGNGVSQKVAQYYRNRRTATPSGAIPDAIRCNHRWNFTIYNSHRDIFRQGSRSFGHLPLISTIWFVRLYYGDCAVPKRGSMFDFRNVRITNPTVTYATIIIALIFPQRDTAAVICLMPILNFSYGSNKTQKARSSTSLPAPIKDR